MSNVKNQDGYTYPTEPCHSKLLVVRYEDDDYIDILRLCLCLVSNSKERELLASANIYNVCTPLFCNVASIPQQTNDMTQVKKPVMLDLDSTIRPFDDECCHITFLHVATKSQVQKSQIS